jgi:hypothetical protein
MNESNPASTKKVRKPISLNWRDLNLRGGACAPVDHHSLEQ